MDTTLRAKVELMSIESANSPELRAELERDPLAALQRAGFSPEEQRVIVGKLMVGELRFEGSIAIFGPGILSPWPPDPNGARTITMVSTPGEMRARELKRVTATLTHVIESDRILVARERHGAVVRVAGVRTYVDHRSKTVTADVKVPEAGSYDVHVCNELGEPKEWAVLRNGLRVGPAQ